MHNVQNRLVLALICLVLAFVCVFSSVWKYPLRSAETLFLPIDQFPSQITPGNRHARWQPYNQPFLPGEELDFRQTLAMDSWITREQEQPTMINQLVYDYSTQLPALWSYLHRSGLPTPGTPASIVIQSELPSGKRFADQERLLCINGDGTTCTAWCYWARYGQYVIRLYISSDQKKLARSVIVQLIAGLDQHVKQRIQ